MIRGALLPTRAGIGAANEVAGAIDLRRPAGSAGEGWRAIPDEVSVSTLIAIVVLNEVGPLAWRFAVVELGISRIEGYHIGRHSFAVVWSEMLAPEVDIVEPWQFRATGERCSIALMGIHDVYGPGQ